MGACHKVYAADAETWAGRWEVQGLRGKKMAQPKPERRESRHLSFGLVHRTHPDAYPLKYRMLLAYWSR